MRDVYFVNKLLNEKVKSEEFKPLRDSMTPFYIGSIETNDSDISIRFDMPSEISSNKNANENMIVEIRKITFKNRKLEIVDDAKSWSIYFSLKTHKIDFIRTREEAVILFQRGDLEKPLLEEASFLENQFNYNGMNIIKWDENEKITFEGTYHEDIKLDRERGLEMYDGYKAPTIDLIKDEEKYSS